jgi:MFS family permease
VATVVTGVLTARFGPRVPVVAGCLLLAVGAAMTASAPGPCCWPWGSSRRARAPAGRGAVLGCGRQPGPVVGSRRALALVNAGSPVGLVVASVLVLVAGDRWRAVWWAFAAIGLVAAAAAWRVLAPGAVGPALDRDDPRLGWFFNARSVRLFVVALGISITSGAYFAYAPDTAQDAGLASWIGPAMWAALGIAGAAVGVFGGGIADRYGLRGPLAVMLVLVGGSTLVLLVAPGSVVAALGSAALFGVGFTTGFALVVMWSQQVFHDRPTTGFTLAIVFIAAGFIVGPSLFGVLATHRGVGRPVALLAAAAPALLVALVPPSPARLAAGRAVADRHTMLWMNTTVVRGRGELLVTATGMDTEIGSVAALLSEAETRPTPLQRQIDVLGRRLALVAGVAVTIVLAVALLQGDTLAEARSTRSRWRSPPSPRGSRPW